MKGEVKKWVENEFKTINLSSKRLESRIKVVMSDISDQPEKSILLSAGGRAQAKAVYRMLRNEKLTEESVLSAHRDATAERFTENGVLLAIQDTMAVNFNGHKKTEGMGYNCEQSLGVNVHSCLLVTPEGIPLGIVAQSVTTRAEAKAGGTHGEKRKRPIEEKESYRWLETMEMAAKNAPSGAELIHVTDREGDIYELYEQAQPTGQQFEIRAGHDRLDTNNVHIVKEIRQTEPMGKIVVTIPENHAKKRKEREAELDVRSGRYEVKRPQIRSGDKTIEASLELNLISVKEENAPTGIEAIDWLLMTNIPVETAQDVLRLIGIYRNRWKIERFHFVLKSGCQIEKLQQRAVTGISMMILLYSIIAIHIMLLTFLSRSAPDTPCDVIFTELEWRILYQAANRTKNSPEKPYSIAEAVRFIAILGGFVRAPSDGPPGLKLIWTGLHDLYTLCAYHEWI